MKMGACGKSRIPRFCHHLSLSDLIALFHQNFRQMGIHDLIAVPCFVLQQFPIGGRCPYFRYCSSFHRNHVRSLRHSDIQSIMILLFSQNGIDPVATGRSNDPLHRRDPRLLFFLPEKSRPCQHARALYRGDTPFSLPPAVPSLQRQAM